MVKIFSERLRDVRTYYGYSQREIAENLGVERSVYAEWEIYRSVIPIRRLIKLADFYKINIDYTLGLTDMQLNVNPIIVDINIVGSNLLAFRKEMNFTTKKLADVLHISDSSITRYEKSQILVSTSFCYNLARKYNISVDYILGRSNTKYIN